MTTFSLSSERTGNLKVVINNLKAKDYSLSLSRAGISPLRETLGGSEGKKNMIYEYETPPLKLLKLF